MKERCLSPKRKTPTATSPQKIKTKQSQQKANLLSTANLLSFMKHSKPQPQELNLPQRHPYTQTIENNCSQSSSTNHMLPHKKQKNCGTFNVFEQQYTEFENNLRDKDVVNNSNLVGVSNKYKQNGNKYDDQLEKDENNLSPRRKSNRLKKLTCDDNDADNLNFDQQNFNIEKQSDFPIVNEISSPRRKSARLNKLNNEQIISDQIVQNEINDGNDCQVESYCNFSQVEEVNLSSPRRQSTRLKQLNKEFDNFDQKIDTDQNKNNIVEFNQIVNNNKQENIILTPKKQIKKIGCNEHVLDNNNGGDFQISSLSPRRQSPRLKQLEEYNQKENFQIHNFMIESKLSQAEEINLSPRRQSARLKSLQVLNDPKLSNNKDISETYQLENYVESKTSQFAQNYAGNSTIINNSGIQQFSQQIQGQTNFMTQDSKQEESTQHSQHWFNQKNQQLETQEFELTQESNPIKYNQIFNQVAMNQSDVTSQGCKRRVDAEISAFNPQNTEMMGQVCQSLSATWNPSGSAPIGRQQEFDSISTILSKSFETQKGSAIYVCGLPGTGKSMTICEVIKSLEQNYVNHKKDAPVVVSFNCCGLGQYGGLFGSIYHQYLRVCNQGQKRKRRESIVSISQSKTEIESNLSQLAYSQNSQILEMASYLSEEEYQEHVRDLVIQSKKKTKNKKRRSSISSFSRSSGNCDSLPDAPGMVVLVLDEMDFIANSKDSSQLKELISLCYRPESKLIVIGIANQLDLPEKHLQDLQSKLHVVKFNTYNNSQTMEQIIQQRLDSLPWKVIDKKALSFICREVSKSSGDIRMALKMIQSVVEALQYSPFNIVNVGVAMGEIRKSMDKQHCQTIQVIQNLPRQHLILLACLVKLTNAQANCLEAVRKNGSKRRRLSIGKSVKTGAFTQRWISMQDLHRCYSEEGQKLGTGRMTFALVKQICEAIQDGANLVRVKGTNVDNQKVALSVEIEVIKYALKDQALVARIYQD
eukprot:TRINITY_DN3798_c0_g1_i9.p1 TRINITY_DN3798_c0_g1~~TRINITY_DN3798_c0_g1_i9.p1  ORF type:complete len:1003 (-),score=110.83 TRINITY_DN3798_c0_g1_i9:465-3413(-)